MKIIGIIPARMASSRFPGKPLKEILGVPMIGHCYHRSKMSKMLDEVYVATCDKEIKEYVESIGGKAVMTSDTHERASDRTAEALLKIEEEDGKKADIVVMIQGDEPLITPEMISKAVKPLADNPKILVSNIVSPLKSEKEFNDPNEVKVVLDKESFALYFSREPIPSVKKGGKDIPMQKQVCIIPFQRDFLLKYNDMPQTPLEIIESVDMMRVLENRMDVKMVADDSITQSVDTADDLKIAEGLLEKDSLRKEYT